MINFFKTELGGITSAIGWSVLTLFVIVIFSSAASRPSISQSIFMFIGFVGAMYSVWLFWTHPKEKPVNMYVVSVMVMLMIIAVIGGYISE